MKNIYIVIVWCNWFEFFLNAIGEVVTVNVIGNYK